MTKRERVNEMMLRIARGEPPRGRPGEPGPVSRNPVRPRIRTGKRVVAKRRRTEPLTVDHRAKLSAAHRARIARVGGRPQSAVTRAKISAAQKLRIGYRAAKCHPDQKNWGNGKCYRCYHREWAREARRKKRERAAVVE